MPREKTPENEALKYRIETRVNETKYRELTALLAKTMNSDMSSLLRQILHHRPVKTYTHDRSLDMVMEELGPIRTEIKAIGININQMTKRFHSYPQWERKVFASRAAFEQYLTMETKIDRLLDLVGKLSKKWLSE